MGKKTLGDKMNRVNSFIGLIFALALVIGFFCKLITADAFLVIAGVAIGYFFPKNDKPTGTV
jgi:uncharacterized membrane protein